LTAWRLYNTWQITDDLDSSWQFLKWTGIDAAFFIALPAFQIPWLEFNFAITLWLLHTIANAFLMYRIPIPIMGWIAGFSKLFYDRELSISEHRVKPADILHNSSIILGKQIIHILPEGSAILNPEKLSFCLDADTPFVSLPIQINQTAPISIELARYDFETDEVENIVITGKRARQLKRHAEKGFAKSDTKTPRTLQYSVSRTGLYRLEKVIDESKLEVRRRSYDVAVVKCPSASVSSSLDHGCAGDLSKVAIQVSGVPPFKVKYNKRINQQQSSSIAQSILPPNEDDEFSPDQASNVVLDPSRPQMGWTQSRSVAYDINEVLNKNGSWTYTVEEVEDGIGNKVSYNTDTEKELIRKHRTGGLTVHNRPIVDLHGCDTSRPLRVAQEDSTRLPVRVRPIDKLPATDWPLKLKYTYAAASGEQVPAIDEQIHHMSGSKDLPRISKAGRYNIESIESQFCTGEIVEPSSCSLFNPPKPCLALDSEEVFDRCAGNPIGMVANLDFTGTPPFKVRYTVTHRRSATPKVEKFNSMRGQLRFMEGSAGSFIYQFLEIEDEVYGPISLKDEGLILKQDIRPPAWANFVGDSNLALRSCLGQSVDVPVSFSGEGPWELEYEIVHGGKRMKRTLQSEGDTALITLPETSDGGEYSVILTGVQDRLKCKNSLKAQRQVEVRPEQPRAAFGDIDGRRSILALQGKPLKVPIRLQGVSPWYAEIRNHDAAADPVMYTFQQPNGVISVDQPGTYEIVSVRDSCPGFVDPKANMFTVSWVARPELSIKDGQVTAEGTRGFRKAPVCQGDESMLALSLSGNSPYHVKYTQKFEPLKGPSAISNKPLSLASNSAQINLETNKAGEYSYVFNELSDDRYSHDRRHFAPITVKQNVYAPPTAKFSTPGKTYGYCKDDATIAGPLSDSEQIPITLTGIPPFAVELAITHHGVSTRPEIVRLNAIPSNSYIYSLSRSSLELGTHTVSIRSVKDTRGCQNILETDLSSVRISVSSPPTIIPLESAQDYCVGEHVSFSLSGQAPFEVFYSFQSRERKARVTTNEFKRIAESPGDFTITGVSDSAMGSGKCRARKEIRKTIHPYPSVMISRGKTLVSDIHEGGDVEINFEFTGTPPFEFTYTRSENVKKGRLGRVLETRNDRSQDFSKTIRASDEGTYEVVAIKDRYCAYARDSQWQKGGKAQKLLQY
jgi:nucleoporin POM152